MCDIGYMFCMKLVLCDVEEEEKDFHLYHHSEKLAITFGFIYTILVLLSKLKKFRHL